MKQTKKQQNKSFISRLGRSIRLAFVPHKANQFRPHFVRSYAIIPLLVAVLVISLAPKWLDEGSVLGVQAGVSIAELADDVNAERQHNDLSPLQLNKQLSQAAFLKAKDMIDRQYWAHNAPDGTTPWQWLTAVDYDYAYAGENLAKNFATADATVAAWMASQKHKDNVLSTHYNEVGFAVLDGVLQGKRTTLIVALFGQPVSAAVAGATTQPRENNAAVGEVGAISRFGIALRSMSPAVLGSVVLLLAAAVVALGAHGYRRQLPVVVRQSWRYHHGAYKATGLVTLTIIVVALYSGGQI